MALRRKTRRPGGRANTGTYTLAIQGVPSRIHIYRVYLNRVAIRIFIVPSSYRSARLSFFSQHYQLYVRDIHASANTHIDHRTPTAVLWGVTFFFVCAASGFGLHRRRLRPTSWTASAYTAGLSVTSRPHPRHLLYHTLTTRKDRRAEPR